MRKVVMRSSHFTFHREGRAPRFRIQADEPTAAVRVEFAARAQLLAPANAAQRTADNYFNSAAGGAGFAASSLALADRGLTYDLPNPVWERLKVHPHVFYRVSATAQTPVDWSAAAPRTVRSVDDAQAAAGRAYYFGVPQDALQAPWVFPDAAALALVPEYYRDKLALLMRYSETHENAYLLRRLGGHSNYTALAPEQRKQALTVFAAADTPARRALLQLFERMIPPVTAGGSATPAVRAVDFTPQRGTVLDNLARFTLFDPHLDIPDGFAVLLAEAIEEIADPSYELNQGRKGTCVPTSVSWMTASYFPAEYVRLCLGLLGGAGNVTLANGDTATVPTDSYNYDPAEQAMGVPAFMRRSWSERMFQSAMMNYSRPGMTYSNMADVFADRRGGLTMSELQRMLQGLRNRPHSVLTGGGADLVSAIAQRLAQPTLPLLTQMRWGTGSHEVVSVRADATDIVVRNPWGGMDFRVGTVLADPPRRCVNPAQAEEAIRRTDLAAAIQSLVVET